MFNLGSICAGVTVKNFRIRIGVTRIIASALCLVASTPAFAGQYPPPPIGPGGWTFSYDYLGTSSFTFKFGGVVTSAVPMGPFTSPQVIGAGYLDTVSASIAARVRVTATWNSPTPVPEEQVFKVTSTSTATGRSMVFGSASNGLGDPSSTTVGHMTSSTGTRYIVAKRNANNQFVFSFNVSANANATPNPQPYGPVHTFANNSLTVLPDTRAAYWLAETEPTFFRAVGENGVPFRKLYDLSNTQNREVATTPIYKLVEDPFFYRYDWVYDRFFSFNTVGYLAYPDSDTTINCSHPERSILPYGVTVKGLVGQDNLLNACLNNTPVKDVALDGLVKDTPGGVYSGISSSASMLVHYYPPCTFITKGPFEMTYEFPTHDNAYTWRAVSEEVRLMPGDAPKEIEVTSGWVIEKSVSVTNGVTSGINLGFEWDGISIGYQSDYSAHYSESASHAKSGGTSLKVLVTPKDRPIVARWGMNPRWRQSFSKCAAYGADGYQGDFTVIAKKWYADDRSGSEIGGAIFDWGWDYLPRIP